MVKCLALLIRITWFTVQISLEATYAKAFRDFTNSLLVYAGIVSQINHHFLPLPFQVDIYESF
jgi:hypothetical protein